MIDLDLKIADAPLELPYPPRKYIEAGGRVVVLMDDLKGHQSGELNRNIQAYDTDGNLLWTIQHPGFEDPDGDANPFVHLGRTDDGVRVADWKGYFYDLDVATGEVDVKGWRK